MRCQCRRRLRRRRRRSGIGGITAHGSAASAAHSALAAYAIAAAGAQAASLAACASVSLVAQAASPLPLARWSSSLSQTSSCPLLRSGFGTSTSSPYSFGASRCSLPLSTAHGRHAPFALEARLSCSYVLRGGLRPSPSLLLPMVLGCLAPLAPVAAPLKREAAVSTAARDGRSNVGASGVGGVGDGSVGGIGGACGVCGGGSAGCATRGVCGGVTGGLSRSSSTISAMVVEFEPDVELTTAPFWFRVRQTPSPAACLALAAVVYRSLRPSAASRRSLEARFSCSLVMFDGLRRLSGARLAQLPATYGPRLPRTARSWSSASHAGGRGGGARRRQRRRHKRRWPRRRRRRRRRASTALAAHAALVAYVTAAAASQTASHAAYAAASLAAQAASPLPSARWSSLAPVAAPLTRGAVASTAARNDGSSVGASGVGGVWLRRRMRRRHRQRMRRWRRVRLRKQRGRVLRTRRMRRHHWRPKPFLLYHQRDGRRWFQ